jgi:hypothetical protein
MRNPEEIRRTAANKYREFLREHFAGRSIFPYRIAFGRPQGARDLDRVATESRRLMDGSAEGVGWGYTVETEIVGTRLGEQRLPVRVFFPDALHYLRFIGKEEEFARITAELTAFEALVPQASVWARAHPAAFADYAGEWHEIGEICRYLLMHPRPGCYPRELPLSVSGKRLGARQAVICEIMSAVPGPHWQTGEDYFEQLGLRRPTGAFIRFRFLDPVVQAANGFPVAEISVPAETLAAQPLRAQRIFIAENLMTYLAFPSVKGAIIVFGAGDASAGLHPLVWLRDRTVIYWGDLDAYGFQILSRLRTQFPEVKSMLMDAATCRQYDHLGVAAPRSESSAIKHLTGPEVEVAAHLWERSWSIEQEKIPQMEVARYLAGLEAAAGL